MAEFAALNEVERTLDGLAARDESLVVRIPRQPGQREDRYAHLLGGEVDVAPAPNAAAAAAPPRADQLADLREEVAALRRDLDEIRTQLGLSEGT
jgi:uncharacterized protein YceH (UPF0502 family)